MNAVRVSTIILACFGDTIAFFFVPSGHSGRSAKRYRHGECRESEFTFRFFGHFFSLYEISGRHAAS
jgi:hypothetical protein